MDRYTQQLITAQPDNIFLSLRGTSSKAYQEVTEEVVTMPKSGFAPKCRVLTTNETQGTFDTWKETLIFNLTLDGTFEFLL